MPASILLTAPQQSVPLNGQPGRTLIVGTAQKAGGAYGTIQEAVNAAQEGDTIFVQPGTYAENVTVSTNYVTLIGAQVSGYGRPDVRAASGVTLTVSAEGFVCKRMRLVQRAADAVVQKGNGFKYEDVVFDGDATAAKAGLRLVPDDDDDSLTASEGIVEKCLFRGCANGIIFDSAAAPVGVGSTDDVIASNLFYSNTLDIATADTGVGLYSCRLTNIVDNYFADKNKATYIDFTTANGGAASDQSGTLARNGFASDTMTTTVIKAVGTGFTFMGNYDTVGVFDGSGLD